MTIPTLAFVTGGAYLFVYSISKNKFKKDLMRAYNREN